MDPMAKVLMRSMAVGPSQKRGAPDDESIEAAPEASEPEDPNDHTVMAQELLDFIKAGDASGVAQVLKHFVDACSSYQDDSLED